MTFTKITRCCCLLFILDILAFNLNPLLLVTFCQDTVAENYPFPVWDISLPSQSLVHVGFTDVVEMEVLHKAQRTGKGECKVRGMYFPLQSDEYLEMFLCMHCSYVFFLFCIILFNGNEITFRNRAEVSFIYNNKEY